MPKHKVLMGPLSHDGQKFDEGDTVELTSEQAAPLVAAGVLASARAERAERTQGSQKQGQQ